MSKGITSPVGNGNGSGSGSGYGYGYGYGSIEGTKLSIKQQHKEGEGNMAPPETIKIDSIEYVRKDALQAPIPGNRYVIVIDRGWIAAGDVEEKDGRIILTRAVWLFGFNGVGFAGAIADPKSKNVDIRPFPNGFIIPKQSEIFRVKVPDNWGL